MNQRPTQLPGAPTTGAALAPRRDAGVPGRRDGRYVAQVPFSAANPNGPAGPLDASDPASAALMGFLQGMARQLTRTFDRQEFLSTIVQSIVERAGAGTAVIRVVEPNGRFVPVAWAGIDDDQARRLPDVELGQAWLSDLFRRSALVCATTSEAPAAGLFGTTDDGGAAVVVPLVHDEQPLGILAATRGAGMPWTPLEVGFVDAIATLAAIGIVIASASSEARLWGAQLGVVQASISRMNRLNTVESIGQAIVEETAQVIDYHNCRVYMLQPPDDLVPVAFRGEISTYREIPIEVLRTKVGEGFTGWVAAHGEPLLVYDAAADPRGAIIPGTPLVDESMVVVPMCFEGSVIGVVTLSKLGLHQFDERDLRLMGILADAAATAVESSRALSAMRRRTDELASLLEMSSALAQTLEPRAVADLIATHIARATGADSCVIGYWERNADHLETWGVYPPDRGKQYAVDRDLHSAPELRRALTSRSVVEVDLDDPKCSEAARALLTAYGHAAVLLVPVVVKGHSIGLIKILSTERLTIDEAQLQLVLAMTNEAGMALENARLYAATRALADRDPLTDFYNHRYLHGRLGEEILRASRAQRPLGLLMIDLDDFKLVNDALGHQMGDRVLRWAADLIRSTLRESDVPARYGGDEFAVILPEADGQAAGAVTQRLQHAFAEATFNTPDHREIPIGLSIGQSSFPADARSPGDLIAVADRALYQAKRAGGHLHDTPGEGDAVPPAA